MPGLGYTLERIWRPEHRLVLPYGPHMCIAIEPRQSPPEMRTASVSKEWGAQTRYKPMPDRKRPTMFGGR